MTMKTLLLGAAITGALMIPALAMAADTSHESPKAEVTKEAPKEAAPAAAEKSTETGDSAEKKFATFDADKSGSISEDEYMNHVNKRNEKYTPEQIAEFKKKRFKEVDTNSDGKIDETEFKAFSEKMKAKRAEMMEKKADVPIAAEAVKEEPKAVEAPKEAPKAEEAKH